VLRHVPSSRSAASLDARCSSSVLIYRPFCLVGSEFLLTHHSPIHPRAVMSTESSSSLVPSDFQPTLGSEHRYQHHTVDSSTTSRASDGSLEPGAEDHDYRQALGFVAVTFQSAHLTKKGGGFWRRLFYPWLKPNPFVVVGFEDGEELALTTYRRNTYVLADR
jgi:hypothetical protein